MTAQFAGSAEEAAAQHNRQCGGTEQLFKDVVAVTVIDFEGAVDFQHLNRALNRVLKENPLLACRMSGRGRNFFFRHDKEIENILNKKSVADEKGKCSFIEQTLSIKFPAGDPLITCTLLFTTDSQHYTLVAAFSHSIYDGVSLSHFVNTLLAAYGTEHTAHYSICRPLEEQILRKKTFSDLKAFLQRELTFRRAGRAGFPFQETAPPAKRSTKSIYKRISKELTKNIALASRKARTTPHGAIMAAMLFALAKQLPENRKAFTMANNVDMRAANKIPMEQMGVYVSVINSLVPVEHNTEFWKLAKECRKNLSRDGKKNMPGMAAFIYAKLAKFTPKWIENKVKKGSTMGRVNDLCISNLGTVKITEAENGLRVKNIISNVAIHEIGADFGLIPIDFRGRTGFNLLYTAPLTSTPMAETLMADFLNLLEQCTKMHSFHPLRQ